jgi:carbamate kinase
VKAGTVVVALGGHALAADGAEERSRLDGVAATLTALAADRRLVITHGNGPQVGMLAEAGLAAGHPDPLDLLDAESAGRIGFLLAEALAAAGLAEVAVLLTRVLVDRADPAFDHPTKPIGPARRRVASPEPHAILDLAPVRHLLEAGMTVVCAGGGGTPVARGRGDRLGAVDAVVDKDLTASLLARELGAGSLVVLTDVDGVHDPWPGGALVTTASVATMRGREWEPGSMAPKVEACCRFVEATGGFAAIGAADDALAVAAGRAGTRIVGG